MDVSLVRCVVCPDCTSVKLPANGDDAFVVCSESDVEEGADAARQPHPAFFVPARDSADRTTVAAVMTTHVVCVAPDLKLAVLERLFVDEGLTDIPVVDAAGLPLGVVSKNELLRWQERLPPRAERPTGTVADIMTSCAVHITTSFSIARAAALMSFENLESVIVVSASDEVVGIVRASDLLGWFARIHGYVLGTSHA
jgi:CBS-domain-containing membrane protein